MIYPKGIVDFVSSSDELRKRFGSVISSELNFSSAQANIDTTFENWMLQEGYKLNAEIKNYLFFLSSMYSIFNYIYKYFEKVNIESRDEKDRMAVTTSPQEMMHIGRYIYYLNSYGISGDVLECGCFKGFSSCCLSWVCNYLGKKLIIADSFEGLPDTGHSFYKKGDFAGSLNTVKENISTLGNINSVEFIKGYFNDSLKGFNRPLSVLWMDVDLYESVMDVLENVFSCLAHNGVIFSHELASSLISMDVLVDKGEPFKNVSQAIRNYFAKNGIKYKARFLIHNLGIIVPYAGENGSNNLSISQEKFAFLMNQNSNLCPACIIRDENEQTLIFSNPFIFRSLRSLQHIYDQIGVKKLVRFLDRNKLKTH